MAGVTFPWRGARIATPTAPPEPTRFRQKKGIRSAGRRSNPRPRNDAPVEKSANAVFLSYASEDSKAARRIRDALRVAGIAVWFDESELRGGDVWDRQIRKQIHDCALFIPVISTHSDSRREGYFRREWKLAVERTADMAEDVAFLVPVVIDNTKEVTALVPDRFREVQWSRLADGQVTRGFVERIERLMTSEPPRVQSGAITPVDASLAPVRGSPRAGQWYYKPGPMLIAALLLVAGFLAVNRWVSLRHNESQAASPAVHQPAITQSAFPEKSIAVLPFVNMSADKDQEYFSDGLTDEMIDLLGQSPDLRVPARTSSFYFKGKNEPIASIAQQLKVAHVLEGSVRKSGRRLRITVQLIRADNGYHMWSQSYDRDGSDVFAVQDEIAKAVVGVLQSRLAAGAQGAGARGTASTEAYSEYLRARQLDRSDTPATDQQALEAYQKAIALDPNYAAAYAGLSVEQASIADINGDADGLVQAKANVEKAIVLGPSDAEGYSARSFIRSTWLWDWTGASDDIKRAMELDPRNDRVHRRYSDLLISLGRLDEAIGAQMRATELDPLSGTAWSSLGYSYLRQGDFSRADAALGRAAALAPASAAVCEAVGLLRLLQHNNQDALATFKGCEQPLFALWGVAMAEFSLGHEAAAHQALDNLVANYSRGGAYQIAEVYAWRGQTDVAFQWLERAYRQRDGGLQEIKVDVLLNSLHSDPRFSATVRKIGLPAGN